jgi:CheY-like chemotaxis protein
LSIVSRIAQLLGAKLNVHSEIGKGTTFSIELPAAASMSEAPVRDRIAVQRPQGRTSDKAHILLVEDDARVRKATSMLLKVEGYQVTAAATVGEAVEQAQNDADIKLLVTDYHLAGGETGMQVVSSVREKLGSELPAIVVTGDTSSAVRDITMDARLRTASKPINPDELLELVRELLASCHA